MFREMIFILHGVWIWQILRFQFCIDKKTVVLILTGDNRKLDWYALVHLKDFMDRKFAKKAVILFYNKVAYRQIKLADLPDSIRLYYLTEKKIRKLYNYYSFYYFSDKIVFTYTDNPKDNCVGKVLKRTQIQEEEVVCLGLYRLRTIPCLKKDKNDTQVNN